MKEKLFRRYLPHGKPGHLQIGCIFKTIVVSTFEGLYSCCCLHHVLLSILVSLFHVHIAFYIFLLNTISYNYFYNICLSWLIHTHTHTHTHTPLNQSLLCPLCSSYCFISVWVLRHPWPFLLELGCWGLSLGHICGIQSIMQPTYQLPGISFLFVLILSLFLVDLLLFMNVGHTIFSLMKKKC